MAKLFYKLAKPFLYVAGKIKGIGKEKAPEIDLNKFRTEKAESTGQKPAPNLPFKIGPRQPDAISQLMAKDPAKFASAAKAVKDAEFNQHGEITLKKKQ